MKPVFSWISFLLIAAVMTSACGMSGLPNTGPNQAAGSPAITQVVPSTSAASVTQAAQGTAAPSSTPEAATAVIQATTASPAASLAAKCTVPAALTPSLTEGPYFKANSPERSSLLETGMAGTKLTITGYVLTADCKPVAHALLDFWQANAQGQYDNSGYTLRGHQYTDDSGRYQLETVVPGLYPGRTEHIHVKVQAPNGPILTTQLFFPGVSNNQSDQIFDPALVMSVQSTNQGVSATYNFVVSQ